MKELEEALLDGRIDVAVHSAKDMTSTDTAGLVVGAYPPREDARDALVGSDRLAPGMRIGTASARRRAQLLALEPSLSIEPLRGNIDTRLAKRSERGLDAIVLAACGLDRLGLGIEVGYRFEPAEVLPEAGQGALALQVREGEEEIVAAVDDAETRRRVVAERACVAAVGGGCLAPVAAYHDGEMLEALVADEDGRWIERRRHDDPSRSRASSWSSPPGDESRRHTRARPGRASRVTHRRAGPRGRALSAHPRRPDRRRAGGAVRLRLGHRHEPERRRGADVAGARTRRARRGDRAGTAAALARAGVVVDLVPAVSTQEGLLAELPRPPGRVLFAAAEGARTLIVDELGADFLPLYRTTELRPAPPAGDVVVLASASAARAFGALGAGIPAVSIGPQTTAAAREAGSA